MIRKYFLNPASLFIIFSFKVFGQMPQVTVPQQQIMQEEDFTWWYLVLFVLFISLIGSVVWTIKSRISRSNALSEIKPYQKNDKTLEIGSLDADKELEWFRKNSKLVGKRGEKRSSGKKYPKGLPQTSRVFNQNSDNSENEDDMQFDSNLIEQKLQTFQFSQLPINKIQQLTPSNPFSPLPLSNEVGLMSAIEQAYDEFEEDEEVRDLALRILAAYRTRNSAEALSQIALYDLSSNLRSKAVSTLAEFNHESVFETILLACADPTREVRAAAARGLFRLEFDRGDAWARIIESNDEFVMRQAARAAIEGGLVEKSFDRLLHQDEKMAYEAVVLVALLIKSGETGNVFEVLNNHHDPNLRKAIFHIIKITRDPNGLEGLYTMLEQPDLPSEMRDEVDKLIEEIALVSA